MLSLVQPEIDAYALAHSTRVHPELLDRLAAETQASTELPQMQVGAIEGGLLGLLVRLSGAQRAVEIGTFTGCSAIHIAAALPEHGTLDSLDINPMTTGIAARYLAEAGLAHRVRLHLQPAAQLLPTLEGPFDFAFIDADKVGYLAYWELLVPRMRPGGLIVADNVLWSGRVLAPTDESTRAIVAFNERVRADVRVDQVMLTVRDGITLARVKAPTP